MCGIKYFNITTCDIKFLLSQAVAFNVTGQ